MYSFDFIFLSLIFKNNELTFFSFIIHILKCNFVCENYENFKSFFLLFLWIKCLINVMNCFLGILFVWEIWKIQIWVNIVKSNSWTTKLWYSRSIARNTNEHYVFSFLLIRIFIQFFVWCNKYHLNWEEDGSWFRAKLSAGNRFGMLFETNHEMLYQPKTRNK